MSIIDLTKITQIELNDLENETLLKLEDVEIERAFKRIKVEISRRDTEKRKSEILKALENKNYTFLSGYLKISKNFTENALINCTDIHKIDDIDKYIRTNLFQDLFEEELFIDYIVNTEHIEFINMFLNNTFSQQDILIKNIKNIKKSKDNDFKNYFIIINKIIEHNK
jgi:hypothetical protein